MIRIECKCKHCNGNAALVPERHAHLVQDRDGRHGFVTMAHDNSGIGRRAASQMGVTVA